MASRLDWIVELLFLGSTSEKETSSTYFQMYDSGVVAFKLITITRNKTGPSFVPWGTQAVIGSQSEIASDSFTRCWRFVRKFVIHGIRDLPTPKSKSFSISKLYPILSKA